MNTNLHRIEPRHGNALTVAAGSVPVAPQTTQDGRFAVAAMHLRAELARRKFGRADRQRRVMDALIELFAHGFWPLKISKDFSELAGVVADGIQKNHCGATLKQLAAMHMVALDWSEEPGVVVVRLQCDARGWRDCALVCGELDWQRRRDALTRLNARAPADLIERDPDLKKLLLETNVEILIEQKKDALEVCKPKIEPSNVAVFSSPASRDGKISQHERGSSDSLPDTGSEIGDGIEDDEQRFESIKSRSSCAKANSQEMVASSRARASDNSYRNGLSESVKQLNGASKVDDSGRLLELLKAQFVRAHGFKWTTNEMANSGANWRLVARAWPMEFEREIGELRNFIDDGKAFTGDARRYMQYYFARAIGFEKWEAVCEVAQKILRNLFNHQ